MRAGAGGGSNKLRRSCAPPRGVAAARCACGAHPSGVLLAASTLIRPRARPHPQISPIRQNRAGGATPCAAPVGCFIGSLCPKQATVHEKIPATLRVARPTPPHAEGATRLARDRLRRRQALVEAANKRRNASDSKSRRPAAPRCDPKKHLRPPVARASRPPPAGSDTRRCSCLHAGRLTRTRWVSYWQPLPDKPIPYQREPFLPRAPGKSCSKAIHAFERFSPSSAARGAARHSKRAASTFTSLYPYKPIPYKSLPDKRKLPSGRAVPACPRRATGSLYPK